MYRVGENAKEPPGVVEAQGDKTDIGPKRAMAKRGVPRISLEVAEGYAKHLWTVARGGTTSEAVLARQIGGEKAKASGGTWRTKVASLNYWGLIEPQAGAQLKLSDIGLRIVRESEPHTVAAARREAVLQVKAYENILQEANGHELPATAGIAGKFHYDYEMSEADAERAAEAFVESVKRAAMVGDDGVVRLSAGEEQTLHGPDASGDVNGTSEEEPPEPDQAPEDELPEDDGSAQGQTTEVSPSSWRVGGPKGVGRIEAQVDHGMVRHRVSAPSSDPDLSVRVKIDMTHWNADDVIKVLATLGLSGRRG